ncbi:MAG: hypothetical protein HUJ75_03405, partial [Parasporobacterium sp.]|nr:hypothetical protein [Parasporobacterium sp.]
MLKNKKLFNSILTLILTAAATVWLGINFDFYYDLNDDVLIKDILSGAYAGSPSDMNIQMQWLLSLGISSLYRIVPTIPWYGLMLLLFQMGSFFILVSGSLKIGDRIMKDEEQVVVTLLVKTLLGLSEMAFFISLMMKHLVNLQYTITVALMSGAAVVWVLSGDETDSAGEFIKNNIPAVLIVFAAYLLRSEMLLLMLPYICVAGIIKWSFERFI